MNDTKTISNAQPHSPPKTMKLIGMTVNPILSSSLQMPMLMVVIVLVQSCDIGRLFVGVGDMPPIDLRVLSAAALVGAKAQNLEVVEIPDLELTGLNRMPIPEGVKNAQASSMFSGSRFRTCLLKEEDLLVVPLHAFRRGGYTCARVYVENLSSEVIELLPEACRLYANDADLVSLSKENEESESIGPTGIEAIVIGFDCELEDFKLLDNGDGPRPVFNGLHVSGYGAQAVANLGCEPYNDFKPTKVILDSSTLEIPSGLHAIVNLCYLPESHGNVAFDLVVRHSPDDSRSGFRVTVGR